MKNALAYFSLNADGDKKVLLDWAWLGQLCRNNSNVR